MAKRGVKPFSKWSKRFRGLGFCLFSFSFSFSFLCFVFFFVFCFFFVLCFFFSFSFSFYVVCFSFSFLFGTFEGAKRGDKPFLKWSKVFRGLGGFRFFLTRVFCFKGLKGFGGG